MKDFAYNKRALFDFEILETFEAGIALLGTEVKSVRAGHMSLRGAFVTMHNGSAELTNATIPPWQIANAPGSYDQTRSRRLLLSEEELKYLTGKTTHTGLTIVPIRVYNRGSRIKVEIGLAKGKKLHNKKREQREKDIKREAEIFLRGKE
ncbi:MAG: SsrA-binding protein [Candidatus Andersenbacteria bacterium RIFCSPHIGHO2_12_FULL_45_11b]|uniref:SsrA-binding protein n=1 Tax=Candidatus Andersenbacteria bacterium RIFCSPHIGHO2_12_FULL_45_11b TaxID=1797282 RepID=A0A1G1X9P9_9BACT|nr:MAG: SsrA-binding protein [Candidatus Andersenbacteria bacterium RIFCSPHIGHO2_12_FULL_45_11b]